MILFYRDEDNSSMNKLIVIKCNVFAEHSVKTLALIRFVCAGTYIFVEKVHIQNGGN